MFHLLHLYYTISRKRCGKAAPALRESRSKTGARCQTLHAILELEFWQFGDDGLRLHGNAVHHLQTAKTRVLKWRGVSDTVRQF